ncbi:MAG: chemotaxis protein CheW [Hyphomicrobium sp.]
MNRAFNRSARSEPDATPTDDSLQFVTFALNGQSYCVEIMSVREIRMLDTVTPVPGAPETIRGVINLRGSIVPVCDLRLRFGQGMTPIQPSHPAVIVSIDGRLMGLLVDQVLDIVTVPRGDVSAIPDAENGRRNPFFAGLITLETGMLIAVDLDRMADLYAAPDVLNVA